MPGLFFKNCSGDEVDPKRCWDWCMSEDDRKGIEPSFKKIH